MAGDPVDDLPRRWRTCEVLQREVSGGEYVFRPGPRLPHPTWVVPAALYDRDMSSASDHLDLLTEAITDALADLTPGIAPYGVLASALERHYYGDTASS